jgi:membrane associated rhomboid family serine protease
MRPRRSSGGGWGLPGVESMSARLALGVVAGSVVFALGQGSFGRYLLLWPNDLLTRLMIWQPLSYAFVETGPFGVFFSALILYSIGGALESDWGGQRLLRVVLGCTVLAGVLTALLGLVVRLPSYPGGNALALVAWVAYGLYIGRGQTNFWGVPITGNVLAAIGAGFVVLNTLFARYWAVQLPEVIALLLVLAYMRGRSPRTLWLRFQQWRLQRSLHGRSRHLHVVDEKPRRDRDSYLN